MPPEIKIIYQLCQKEIFETINQTDSDLKAWLATGEYLLHRPLEPISDTKTNKFVLQVNYWDSLYASLANDCNRFAQAAIESMWLIRKDEKLPKSAGWAAVQMYYSAFYSAHAILRIFGKSCTQLENAHVCKVHEIAVATEQENGVRSIENGLYLSSIDRSHSYIEYSKLKDSHADTWSSFNNLLKWLIDKIPDNTTGIGAHKESAMTLISNTKSVISKAGASRGNWPSQVRNKIHYQHSHGVWFPYRTAIHNQQTIMRNTQWLNSPVSFDFCTNNDDIYSLYIASNSMLSLLFHLVRYGFERSGSKSYPLANGTFRLINQIQVRS